MAKFALPVSESELKGLFESEAGKKILTKLGADSDFAVSCFKAGFVNKQYHKARQMEDQMLKSVMRGDRSLREAVEKKVQEQLRSKTKSA